MWTLNDSTGVFRQDANPDRTINAVKQKWKEFDSFENQDIQKIQRNELIQENTVLALKIKKSREANLVYSNELGKMVGSWKVPEVEGLNRTFNEGTRYYNLPY